MIVMNNKSESQKRSEATGDGVVPIEEIGLMDSTIFQRLCARLYLEAGINSGLVKGRKHTGLEEIMYVMAVSLVPIL
jgi:hypothetical protein